MCTFLKITPTMCAGTDVLWVTDTTPPVLEKRNLSASGSAIRAHFRVDDGATLQCTLTRTAHFANTDDSVGGNHTLTWNGCVLGLNSSCYHVAIAGFVGDNSGIVNGAYRMRECNANVSIPHSASDNTSGALLVPCMVHGWPIYDHTDQQVVLRYSHTTRGWVVQNADGKILASRTESESDDVSVPGASVSVNVTGAAGWVAPSNGNASGMRVSCGLCAGLCPNIVAYDALPSGYYTLCVTATDTAGNTGVAVCDSDIVVRTSAEETALALGALSDENKQVHGR